MEDIDFGEFGGVHAGFGGPRGFMHARRGDMRPIVLGVLKHRPMHGYEIIRHLEEQSHGMWRPSPGSIYPTLQLLEEEDLVSVKNVGGKKVYELTEKGSQEAEEGFEGGPWMHHDRADLKKLMPLRRATADLIRTQRRVVRHALKHKDYAVITRVIEVLGEAKTKLEAVTDMKGEA